MCFHDSERAPEPTFTQFSSTTSKGERVTVDVRPAPASGGHIVALFNHGYPELPIVMRLPKTQPLDEAKRDAGSLLDAYDSGPLVSLVKLSLWAERTGAEPYAADGYRGGEGIFDVA